MVILSSFVNRKGQLNEIFNFLCLYSKTVSLRGHESHTWSSFFPVTFRKLARHSLVNSLTRVDLLVVNQAQPR